MNLKKYLYESAKYLLRCPIVIRPYIKEVEDLYTMPAEQLKVRNEQRFLEIFQKAYDKSPFYHKLYTEAGIKKEDITCLADLKRLPVVTKDMVKAHADDILTVPRFMVHGGCTSGTTGTPLKVYKDWKAIWRSQAYLYVMRKRCGFTYGQPFASLRGNLDKRDMMLKVHVSNTIYFSSYNINPEKVKFYYEQIVRQKPVAIEGYPSSLYTLALMLRDAKLELYIPIAFTSSETLLDYQRELIEQILHTEIFDLYGMTEESICLHETLNHKGYYEAPGFSINEYLEDGEICTSLINDSFPLIRYRSNDVIELYDENELEEEKFLIQRIEGRKEDYLICKDGSKVMRLDFLFKGVSHVKVSQLIQGKDGKLSINIVPEDGFTEADKAQVEQNLLYRLGEGNIDYRITLISENDIRYTSRGKFKYLANLTNIRRVRIKRILGRMDDYLVGKNGEICQRLNQIAKKARHSKAMQMIQIEQGKVSIYIVPDGTFTQNDEIQFIHAFEELVGVDTFDYSIQLVSDIKDLTYTSRGKFKMVINNIKKLKYESC